MFAYPRLPFSRRDSVPRSRAVQAVSVAFQPASSVLSRIGSPTFGGFRTRRYRPRNHP